MAILDFETDAAGIFGASLAGAAPSSLDEEKG